MLVSYLTNRRQFVAISEDYKSTAKEITCGVPQGFIIGPLLFITYINDFHHSSDKLSFILFADDSNIFYPETNRLNVVQTIDTDLLYVADWIQANKLSLNIDKTNYMLFSLIISSLPQPIMYKDYTLSKVQSTKFLGVLIDDKLTSKLHFEATC